MLRKCAALMLLLFTACSPPPSPPATAVLLPTLTPAPFVNASPTPAATVTPAVTSTPARAVPNFEHIVMIMFENKEFGSVIGSAKAPYF